MTEKLPMNPAVLLTKQIQKYQAIVDQRIAFLGCIPLKFSDGPIPGLDKNLKKKNRSVLDEWRKQAYEQLLGDIYGLEKVMKTWQMYHKKHFTVQNLSVDIEHWCHQGMDFFIKPHYPKDITSLFDKTEQFRWHCEGENLQKKVMNLRKEAKPPYRLEPPNQLIWDNKSYKLSNLQYKILKVLWDIRSLDEVRVNREIWSKRVVLYATKRSAVCKLNTRLLGYGIPLEVISGKTGFCLNGVPK